MRPSEACTCPSAADSTWVCNTVVDDATFAASSVLALLWLLPAGSSVTSGSWSTRSGLSLILLPLVFDSLLLLVLPVPTVLPGRPVSTEVKENKKSLHETNEAALVIAHVMAP